MLLALSPAGRARELPLAAVPARHTEYGGRRAVPRLTARLVAHEWGAAHAPAPHLPRTEDPYRSSTSRSKSRAQSCRSLWLFACSMQSW